MQAAKVLKLLFVSPFDMDKFFVLLLVTGENSQFLSGELYHTLTFNDSCLHCVWLTWYHIQEWGVHDICFELKLLPSISGPLCVKTIVLRPKVFSEYLFEEG